MSTLAIHVGAESCAVHIDGQALALAVGPAQLIRTELHSDPPLPEELTNAIGVVIDHLDDLLRELPAAIAAERIEVDGAEMKAIAAVEIGRAAELPFELSHDAAEDVFRTVATEPRADRARNPGLEAHLVGTVTAGACIVVALMRHLRLDRVTIVEHHEAAAAGRADRPIATSS